MAGEEYASDIFRDGVDIYCDMATWIYGYEMQKATHPIERQFGKQAILGLGYSMGFVTFLLTCRGYKIYFSHADVLRILGPVDMAKYEAWVRDHLCLNGPPIDPSPETIKKYKDKKTQAARVRRRLRAAREDHTKIDHEVALL